MGKYTLLFFPLILSFGFYESPEISYFIAWGGSFWVFYLVLSGTLKPIPSEYSLLEQAMRPMILPHIIYAGYMACTSIFYFMDTMGYYYLERTPGFYVDEQHLLLVAQCQRYYLTSHIFFIIGINAVIEYDTRQKYVTYVDNISSFMLTMTLYINILSFVVRFIPGMAQIYIMLVQLSSVSSIVSLAFALPEKKALPILVSGFLFITSYISAIASGWKEAILVPLILLGIYLYPNYKKLVLISAPIALFMYFYFVPTYNSIVREQSWGGEMDGLSASSYAIDQISSGEADIENTNWDFLTGRLSEIGMFVKYVEKVPQHVDFYGFKIVGQGLISIIPRVFYPSKPVTEELVMARAIECEVISAYSTVSAKPPLVVDGYLSCGILGIVITSFIFGILTSWASVKAEELFGSYIIGSGVVYTGLFQVLWRGNCFEFMFNSLIWSIIIMIVLHRFALSLGVVKTAESIQKQSPVLKRN